MGKSDVQVFARFRPLNRRELKDGGEQQALIFRPKVEGKTITVDKPVGDGSKDFTFDHIFGPEADQQTIYEHVARPIVEQVMKGFNATLLAYGQTGAGKTYTLTGGSDEQSRGLVGRMMHDIFQHAHEHKRTTLFTIKCSYVEIYMERIRDLLNVTKSNLKVRELITGSGRSKHSHVYIENRTICTVRSLSDMLKVMNKGLSNRTVASTNMNDQSSRSHAVFSVIVVQTDMEKQVRKSSELFLVDLAGSEKVARTGATGTTLEQAAQINKSLSALSNVINALTRSKKVGHVPYRDSKLTRLLTNSLGGNAKTALILALSPAPDSLAESYSTLQFGARAKRIENKAQVNQEMSLASYKKLTDDLKVQVDYWKRRSSQLAMLLKKHKVPIPASRRTLSSVSLPIIEEEAGVGEAQVDPSQAPAQPAALSGEVKVHEERVQDFSNELGPEHVLEFERESDAELKKLRIFHANNTFLWGCDDMFSFTPLN